MMHLQALEDESHPEESGPLATGYHASVRPVREHQVSCAAALIWVCGSAGVDFFHPVLVRHRPGEQPGKVHV